MSETLETNADGESPKEKRFSPKLMKAARWLYFIPIIYCVPYFNYQGLFGTADCDVSAPLCLFVSIASGMSCGAVATLCAMLVAPSENKKFSGLIMTALIAAHYIHTLSTFGTWMDVMKTMDGAASVFSQLFAQLLVIGITSVLTSAMTALLFRNASENFLRWICFIPMTRGIGILASTGLATLRQFSRRLFFLYNNLPFDFVSLVLAETAYGIVVTSCAILVAPAKNKKIPGFLVTAFFLVCYISKLNNMPLDVIFDNVSFVFLEFTHIFASAMTVLFFDPRTLVISKYS